MNRIDLDKKNGIVEKSISNLKEYSQNSSIISP